MSRERETSSRLTSIPRATLMKRTTTSTIRSVSEHHFPIKLLNRADVRSFGGSNKGSPRKPENKTVHTRIDSRGGQEDGDDAGNPTKVEVYKVTDLLKSERNRTQQF